MSEQKPKIFAYCLPATGWGPNDVIGYALAEDGVGLASHLSTNVAYSHYDMVAAGSKDKEYKAHYPNGYEVVWLGDAPADNDYTNPEFLAAFEKNKVLAAAKREKQHDQ